MIVQPRGPGVENRRHKTLSPVGVRASSVDFLAMTEIGQDSSGQQSERLKTD